MDASPQAFPPESMSLVKEVSHFLNYDTRIMKTELNQKYLACYSTNSGDFKRLNEEAKGLHLLEHRSLNKFIGIGKNQIAAFYQEIPFCNLSQILPEMNPTEKLVVLYGVASALNYLHSNNILFYNLNSTHIYLNRLHEPLLDSYGLSSFVPKISELPFVAPELLNLKQNHNLSSQANFNKTPKQNNQKENIDLSCVDIFSFGYFMIEVITGSRPSLLRRTSDRYMYSFPSDLPDFIKPLVIKCIKHDPKERATFPEILKGLSEASCVDVNVNEDLFSTYTKNVSKGHIIFARPTFQYPISRFLQQNETETNISIRTNINDNTHADNNNNNNNNDNVKNGENAQQLIQISEPNSRDQNGVPSIDIPRIRFRFHQPETARPNNIAPLSGTRHAQQSSNSLPVLPFRSFQMQMFMHQEVPNINDIDVEELQKRNDPDSKYLLGYYHEENHEYEQAFALYNEASKKDHAHALYRMGLLFMNGQGCKKNIRRASKLFLKAAKQRHSDAAYQFCILHSDKHPTDVPDLSTYRNNRVNKAGYKATSENKDNKKNPRNKNISKQNPNVEEKNENKNNINDEQREKPDSETIEELKQCMSYLQYSADIGFADSIFKLAYLVENGLCFEKDEIKAFDLYRRAALRGVIDAQYCVAIRLLEGRGTPRVFSDAAFFLQKATRKGHVDACYKYAELLESGIGIRKNISKAAEFYREAASKGHPGAKRNYARMLRSGNEAVPKNERMAFSLMNDSASAGDIEALNELGEMYESGCGVDKNLKEAFNCFVKASKHSNSKAQSRACVNLGLMYETGHATQADSQKACEYFKTAANQKDPLGQFHFARALENGIGIQKDLSKAAVFYRLSANQGCSRAQYNIARYLEYGLGIEKDKSLAIQYYKCAARQGVKAAEKAVLRLRPNNCL
ncbi:hypothetical protein TRFO_13045 [Tritrichomonas foetus]|uniref:Protein kinase domain-containing protein n=1 Tax=Tritrichomonas foetus TaxID=1144522 RepID=A0A1J4KZE8_9EUKA|nr:hypothetical protein TRFO_13045 [Tritrichomonas foetus]|eukprot:OHT16627.1 hypothetical protein TRFO_13045 [Tritrichomonas foetus]